MTEALFNLPSEPPVVKTAVLSECGRYRYSLGRTWGPGPGVVWVMLNPSTADAEVDDRTIGRCIAFARRWGYDGIHVVNLYAWRATDPAELLSAPDPVGPENDRYLAAAAHAAYAGGAPLVGGWGANAMPARVRDVVRLFGFDRLQALRVTKRDGYPGHPLYVPGDAELQPWSPRPESVA